MRSAGRGWAVARLAPTVRRHFLKGKLCRESPWRAPLEKKRRAHRGGWRKLPSGDGRAGPTRRFGATCWDVTTTSTLRSGGTAGAAEVLRHGEQTIGTDGGAEVADIVILDLADWRSAAAADSGRPRDTLKEANPHKTYGHGVAQADKAEPLVPLEEATPDSVEEPKGSTDWTRGRGHCEGRVGRLEVTLRQATSQQRRSPSRASTDKPGRRAKSEAQPEATCARSRPGRGSRAYLWLNAGWPCTRR